MSVVARERLAERVEQYADRNPGATLPEVLGRFLIDPDQAGEERSVAEAVLDSCEGRPAPHDADDGDREIEA